MKNRQQRRVDARLEEVDEHQNISITGERAVGSVVDVTELGPRDEERGGGSTIS